MMAWSKSFVGWVNPQEVSSSLDDEEIRQAETNADVYQLLHNPGGVDWRTGSPGNGEYFLVENRQQTAFDAGLPGRGILIWHIDESRRNNADESHRLVDLEEADDDDNPREAADAFADCDSCFTETTNPNSDFYRGIWSRHSGVKVVDISASGAAMTADLMSRQIDFVVDDTGSMWDEIDLAKSTVINKINELAADDESEYYTLVTFKDSVTVRGQTSQADTAISWVSGLYASGGGDCPEESLGALRALSDLAPSSEAWLMTDASPHGTFLDLAATIFQLLRDEITVHPIIYDWCSALSGSAAASQEYTPSKGEAQLVETVIAPVDELGGGVPFTRIARDTGGHYFRISSSETGDALATIMDEMETNASNAQIYDSVDTVGVTTYAVETTGFSWIDAQSGTSILLSDDDYAQVALPTPFTFYGVPYGEIYVGSNGFVSFGSGYTNYSNQPIPSTSAPNGAIYGLWDDLNPSAGGVVYTLQTGDIFVVEYFQVPHYGSSSTETFEIILNFATQEIVVQYQQVGDASSATVGVENQAGDEATQYAYNDATAIFDGLALRFSPQGGVPESPKAYQVAADASLSRLTFLLNLYSGSASMTVHRPDGSLVNPTDAGVTYIETSTSKYYKIDLPPSGTWEAEITGRADYAFSSSGITPIQLRYLGDTSLGFGHPAGVVASLTGEVASASFSLVSLDGASVVALDLYDDGAHGDDQPGDGVYGGSYTPTAIEEYHLRADGTVISGEPFSRIDPVTIRVQSISVEASADAFVHPGETVPHTFTLENLGAAEDTFDLSASDDQGWADLSGVPSQITIGAGGSASLSVPVSVPLGAAEGATDEVVLLVVSQSNPLVNDGGVIRTTATVPIPYRVVLSGPPSAAPGETVNLIATIFDQWDQPVEDGTTVTFDSTLGTFEGGTETYVTSTTGGAASAQLTLPWTPGSAVVRATSGDAYDEIVVEVEVVMFKIYLPIVLRNY